MIIRRERNFISKSFCNTYRPCLVDEILGQETSKRIIKNGLDTGTLLHTLMFVGPAGCGKTTAARIIALGLNCERSQGPTSTPCLECPSCLEILNGSSIDVLEINVGKEGGKADIDSIIDKLNFSPLRLRYKVIIFDEAHKLTDAAKDLLLKPIEDGLSYVYYIFCTNQPDKLRKIGKDKDGTPFIDRCTVIPFEPIKPSLIKEALIQICMFEGIDYKENVLDIMVEESHGVPRKAIMWLEQIVLDKSWSEEAISNIIGSVFVDDPKIFELCQCLNNGQFKNAVKEYEKVRGISNIESIRIIVASYFISCLKNAKTEKEAAKFDKILDIVNEPIFNEGKIGDNKLTHNMYKVTKIIKDFKRGDI